MRLPYLPQRKSSARAVAPFELAIIMKAIHLGRGRAVSKPVVVRRRLLRKLAVRRMLLASALRSCDRWVSLRDQSLVLSIARIIQVEHSPGRNWACGARSISLGAGGCRLMLMRFAVGFLQRARSINTGMDLEQTMNSMNVFQSPMNWTSISRRRVMEGARRHSLHSAE